MKSPHDCHGLALTLLLLLSGWARGTEVLDIAAEDDAGNWSLKDGTGFANELVVAAFKAVDVEAQLKVQPYARCKREVEQGTVAACFSMSKLPDLEPLIAFPNLPLFVCHSDFFQNLKQPLNLQNEKDLPRGTVVGTVTGYEYPDNLYVLRDKGVVVLEETASEELNLKKLADGRIQLALINYNETKPAEVMETQSGTVGKVGKVLHCGDLNSWIGFSKKHPKGAWALEKFNTGFKIITENGTLQRIQDKWAARAQAELASAQPTPPAAAEKPVAPVPPAVGK